MNHPNHPGPFTSLPPRSPKTPPGRLRKPSWTPRDAPVPTTPTPLYSTIKETHEALLRKHTTLFSTIKETHEALLRKHTTLFSTRPHQTASNNVLKKSHRPTQHKHNATQQKSVAILAQGALAQVCSGLLTMIAATSIDSGTAERRRLATLASFFAAWTAAFLIDEVRRGNSSASTGGLPPATVIRYKFQMIWDLYLNKPPEPEGAPRLMQMNFRSGSDPTIAVRGRGHVGGGPDHTRRVRQRP